MKLETMIKWGALGVAAATTAAGSVLITAKAVKKLETETFPEDPTKKGLDMKNVPAIDKLVSGSLKISNKAKEELTKDEEPIFKSDFKYTVPVTPTEAPIETPTPAPIPDPIPTPIPELIPTPVAAPIPEPVVVSAQEPIPVAIPTPIPEPIPTPIVEPVPEEKPEEKYTYVPMDLPYLAGKLGKDDEECKEVVITPAEAEAEAKEPITTETASMPVIEAPVLEVPVADVSAEPIVSAEAAPVKTQEPEIVLPTAEMIDEHPNTTPVLGSMEKPAETFADINPLAQGFSVAMSDNVENALPTATEAASTFADFAPVNDTAAPITFNDLNSEYVEEISPVVEVKSEPVEIAPVVEAPAAEVAQVVETPVAEVAPIVEEPVVEAAPIVEEPVAEAAPIVETPQGKSVTIGGAVVSDLVTDPSVMAVANTYHIPIGNLVSITAEGNAPMVFEFLYSDMRNDATLINVYFMLPDGQATLPPEADRENVLAFGRNFITGNGELKAFLA